MNIDIVTLLVTIIVVTILVTLVLAVVTYVAYKLRLSREPAREENPGGLQYFVQYQPQGLTLADPEAGPRLEEPAKEVESFDVESLEGYATEA